MPETRDPRHPSFFKPQNNHRRRAHPANLRYGEQKDGGRPKLLRFRKLPAVLASNRHHHHFLENDGRLEHAQQMAGHESPRTTKLYDRTKDEITLSEMGQAAVVIKIFF